MPDNEILPLRQPRLRWCVCTRNPGEPWVETTVEEDLREVLLVVAAALECNQCVMVEPIRPHRTAG